MAEIATTLACLAAAAFATWLALQVADLTDTIRREAHDDDA